MAATVPLIEGADYADPTGVGRPHREIDTHDSGFFLRVCSQFGEQSRQGSRL